MKLEIITVARGCYSVYDMDTGKTLLSMVDSDSVANLIYDLFP